MALTRKQLDELNGTSFPDNDTGDITPDVHRDYNTEVLDYIDEKDGGTLKNASANNFIEQLLNGALKFMGISSANDTRSIAFYDKGNNIFLLIDTSNARFGSDRTETVLVSSAKDLLHNRAGDGTFPIWDAYNLPIATVNELKALITGALKNASANNYATQEINGTLKLLGESASSQWSYIVDKNNIQFLAVGTALVYFGSKNKTTNLLSNNHDLIHKIFTGPNTSTDYKIWDEFNLPNPATKTEIKIPISNYLSSAADGFLVKTKITPASLAMCTLTVTGNSYTNSRGNYLSVIQFYSYTADQIPYTAVTHVGTPFDVQIFYYEGFVHLYISKLANPHSTLSVTGTVIGGGNVHLGLKGYQIVESITQASAVPDGATVITTPKAYLMASQDDLKKYARNTRATKFQTTETLHSEITTAQFIAFLKEQGAFDGSGYWSTMGTWSFANNDVITDTGCGDITLAGAYVELLSMSETEYDIRISTAPSRGGDENAITNAVFICRVRSGIPLKWERLANTSDLSGYLPATGKAKYLEATYPSGVQYPNEVPENSAVARMIRLTGPHVTSDINGYADVVFMDAYAGGDVPAVTGIGVMKNTAGRAFIFSGLRTEDNSTPWTVKELATKDDVVAKQDTLVSGQNIKTINGQSVVGSGDLVLDVGLNNAFKVVSALPATGDPKYIYLLPKSESESNDSYYEYIWLEDYSRWERIGSTQIDLSDYYNKTQADARYVRLDPTAQTITGIKTFASLPIVPTVEPSADGQVVSRAWLNKKVQPIQTAVTSLQGDVGDMKPTVTKHSADISSLNASVFQLETEVAGKEDKLKSGENIKTINRQSILGAGNIEISGGGSSWNVVEIEVETGQPVPAVNVTGSTIFRAIGSAVNNSLTFNIENPSDMGTSLLKAGESFKVVCYAVIDVTFNAENIGSRMFDLDWESQSGAGTGSESYMEYEVTYTGQELLFKRRRFTYANE